jgi:SSS family solute:Na+ symporter
VTALSLLDNIIILFYFITVLGIGLYFSRKRDHSSADYFLAGRNIGWIALGISLFATNISSEHFVGLAGSGASRGIAVAPFEWMAIFILVILGYAIAPIYLKAGVYTVPEFLEKRFDKRTRLYLSSLSIIVYIFTKTSITLFAGGLLLHEVLDWDIYTSTLVMVMLTGLYTVIGGLKAVIYTQIFQAVFFLGGAILLTVYGLKEVGGLHGLYAKLPADYFAMIKPVSDPDFPWTGILFGAPIIGFWYWCTDQYIVQRVLSARSVKDARRGTLLTAFLKILPVFVFVIPGLIAVALFPGANGDQAYPFLLNSRILPVGIKGLVVAGVMAAIMSSLASVFTSASTLFTMDLYRSFKPAASERKLVLVGRLATTVIVICAILWVPMIKYISTEIYIYLQSIQAYVSPPIAAVFILGVYYKKINSRGAIWGLTIGGFFGLLRLILEMFPKEYTGGFTAVSWFVDVNYLHFAAILFVFSSAVMVLVSRLFAISVLEPERLERYN